MNSRAFGTKSMTEAFMSETTRNFFAEACPNIKPKTAGFKAQTLSSAGDTSPLIMLNTLSSEIDLNLCWNKNRLFLVHHKKDFFLDPATTNSAVRLLPVNRLFRMPDAPLAALNNLLHMNW